MMKKILFVHHAAGWSGASKSMIETIKSLDRQKYAPMVLLLKQSVIAEKLEECNIPYQVANSVFYRKYYRYFTHSEAEYTKWYHFLRLFRLLMVWPLSKFVFVSKELKRIDFDIVHLNSSVLTDWLKPCSKRAKTIIHIREPFRKGKYDLLHLYFRHQMDKYADVIIAISHDNARRVNLPEKTRIIYNYDDINQRAVKEDSYKSKTFLYVGGASPTKGFYTLVDALEHLNKDIKIIFGGKYDLAMISGSWVKKLLYWHFSNYRKRRKAVNIINSNTNTQLVGMISNMSDYLVDVCGVISPFDRPHFSRPAMEAHLYSKAAIGSDVEGMDEIIVNHINGLLFPTGNATALADRINYMAKHPMEAKKMGQAGFKVAEVKFTSTNVKQIEKIYFDL